MFDLNVSHCVFPIVSSCFFLISECILAPFVSGATSQQIPFVFLPLKGQIIHPSKEISFKGTYQTVKLLMRTSAIRPSVSNKGWRTL